MENKKGLLFIGVAIALSAVTLVFVIIGFVLNSGEKPVSAAIAGETTLEEDSVSAYGQGKVSVKPDTAYVTFGVENNDADPKKAQDDNTRAMNALMAAIRTAGVDEADIQTVEYNVYAKYDYHENTRDVIGYRVTNLVRVKLKETGKAGELIKAAYGAGANRFDGIQFDVADRQQAYLQALEMASDRALEKAQKLAEKSGRKIAGVIEIVESGAQSRTVSSIANYVSAGASSEASAAPDAPVSPGELEISASVTVRYRLE